MSKSPASGSGIPAVTTASLEAAALRYLARYAASAQSLRRVLRRRVEWAARQSGTDPAAAEPLLASLVGRLAAHGLLDDRRYAEAKALALFRRGSSEKAIRAFLATRGVAADLIEASLAECRAQSAEAGRADREAAFAYARRRRLGPFRPAEVRAAHRNRDLAALGRAGFSWADAKAVIDQEEA
jgi:regulatory protein